MKRLWFPQAPSNNVDVLQRTQLGVGYSILTIPIIPVFLLEFYFRRYLQDTLTIELVGPALVASTGVETAETTYLRRYLQDPLV